MTALHRARSAGDLEAIGRRVAGAPAPVRDPAWLIVAVPLALLVLALVAPVVAAMGLVLLVGGCVAWSFVDGMEGKR